jgi:CPA1 family monovalent cation:H+ antiporter
MMGLMIPDNLTVPGWNYPFTIKEFLLTLIVMSIMFTLFVKAPTIKPLIKLFKLNKLNKWEKFELLEGNILINLKLLKQIENLFKQGFIHKTEYEEFKNIYTKKLKEDIEKLKNFLKGEKDTHDFLKRAILIHALGMEKMFLKELFTYREIDEHIFKYLLKKIDTQIERLKKGLSQFKTFEEKQKKSLDIFERI